MNNHCIQQEISNKCICKKCNETMGYSNNLNHYNKSVPEISFSENTNQNVNSLERLEKNMIKDDNYEKSFYRPPVFHENGQEYNYPYKYRNHDNIWFHNEGGDFGGHSLYENPFVGPRNSDINKYAYGSRIPYIQK